MPTSSVKRDLEAKLSVLNGAEWDSSDDDEVAEPDKKKTKTVSTTKEAVTGKKVKSKKGKAATVEEEVATNVIYLGHLPANFEEAELRGFLGQFGQVKRLKLSRSRKTGTPRGFAFVEFDDADVAAVVADTMSGYLMGEKRVVCHMVPEDKIRVDMFKGSDRMFRKIDWAALHRKKANAPKSTAQMKTITKRLVGRERKKRDKLKELGIEYDFPGYEKKVVKGSKSPKKSPKKSARKSPKRKVAK